MLPRVLKFVTRTVTMHSRLEKQLVFVEKRHHIGSLWIRLFSRSNRALL